MRFFIRASARGQAFTTGDNTFLGRLWLVLNPILQVAVYALVFGLILKISRGMDNFLGFLTIGVTFFGFLSRGLSAGSNLITSSRGMIRSFDIPSATVAISSTAKAFYSNLVPAVVAVVLALAFQADKPVSPTILLIPFAYVLMHLFIAGCTLITARLTAFVPDFASLISVFVRALFFISGIFFDIDRFDDVPWLRDIMILNPFYQFLKLLRTLTLDGNVPHADAWIYLLFWSVIIFTVGIIFFWQAEPRYKRVR